VILQPQVAYKKDELVWYYPQGYNLGERIAAKVTSDNSNEKSVEKRTKYTIVYCGRKTPDELKDGERVDEVKLKPRSARSEDTRGTKQEQKRANEVV
jgi:hypothetical protein